MMTQTFTYNKHRLVKISENHSLPQLYKNKDSKHKKTAKIRIF